MALQQYALAAGHDVAQNLLENFENTFAPFNRGRRIAPRTIPIRLFPQSGEVMTGRVVSWGRVDTAWMVDAFTLQAMNEYIRRYHTVGGQIVKSAPVTLFTKVHHEANYGRFNAYSILPDPPDAEGGDGDLEYFRNIYINVRFRFNGLVRL